MQSFDAQYSGLFTPTTWGPIRAQFRLLDEPPPGELISNANLVPRVGENWLILLLDDGVGATHWEIPGGTLEPDENYQVTLRRELWEEAGAEISSCQVMGAWYCTSLRDKPYRPHLPHPISYRLACVGEVVLVRSPTNPVGDEQVKRVEVLPLEVVVKRFRSINRHDLADLYRLAAHLALGMNE